MFNLKVALLLGHEFDRHGFSLEDGRMLKVYDDIDYELLKFDEDILRTIQRLENKFSFNIEFMRIDGVYKLIKVHGREIQEEVEDVDFVNFFRRVILGTLNSKELEDKVNALKEEYPWHYNKMSAL